MKYTEEYYWIVTDEDYIGEIITDADYPLPESQGNG